MQDGTIEPDPYCTGVRVCETNFVTGCGTGSQVGVHGPPVREIGRGFDHVGSPDLVGDCKLHGTIRRARDAQGHCPVGTGEERKDGCGIVDQDIIKVTMGGGAIIMVVKASEANPIKSIGQLRKSRGTKLGPIS